MSFLRRSMGGGSTKTVELGGDVVVSAFDATSPYTATATYQINSSVGTYTTTNVGTSTTSNTVKWGFRGDFSAFYVRATLVSGSTPTGSALNVWLTTNSNRSWSISVGGSSGLSDQAVIKIEISRDASTVLDSHQVTLGATT